MKARRTITITAQLAHAITELQAGSTMNIDCFDAELTGKKEIVKKGVSTTYNDALQQLFFTILLSPNDPAIIPYSEKCAQAPFWNPFAFGDSSI